MNLNILICGSGNEGKGTFLNNFDGLVKVDDETYQLGIGQINIEFKVLNMYEHGYDAEIIMFDLSCPQTFSQIPPTNKPRIIVGNKSDISVITAVRKTQIKSMGYEYIEINRKSERVHYIKPLSYLIQELVGYDFRMPVTYLTDKRKV